jgi:uncharacterized membrane protein YGL010W
MPTPFRPATELLVQYARYHRDQRNIATHFVGIPMIVFAIGVLLGRPAWAGTLTPAWALWLLATLWYLTRGQLALGLAVSMLNLALLAGAAPLAGGSTTLWLGAGLALFALGWAIQFLGHYYEGRKPAFADDLVGLLVGPQFIVAEWLFALGWGQALRAEIERRAGPTHLRDLAMPTA